MHKERKWKAAAFRFLHSAEIYTDQNEICTDQNKIYTNQNEISIDHQSNNINMHRSEMHRDMH